MDQKSLPELSDAELVQLCQERGVRDDRPFQELYRRYQAAIWRVCYSFTRNAHDAEDLTQEVFLKVYYSLKKFERRASFKNWIYRIAINSSQNEIRRRRSRPQVSETEVEMMAEQVPAANTVESEVQQRRQRARLIQALAQLNQEAYEVWHLKDLEQRPYAEIAQMLDIGVSAAKMRVQRARLAIQAAYRRLEAEGN